MRHFFTWLAAAIPCTGHRVPSYAFAQAPSVAPVKCDCDILATVAWNDGVARQIARKGLFYSPWMGHA